MPPSRTTAIVLALLVMPLTGCIGQEEAPLAEQATDALPEPPEPAGNPTTLHTAGANATDPALEALGLNETGLPSAIGLPIDAPIFEPTIGVQSDGTLFVSNTGKGELTEEDPPGDTEYSSILRSTDQGKTWEDVTGSIGPVSIPPETGDPYVYVDRATDRVYNLDMIGLNCNWVRWSDDAGDSWINNPAGCGQPPVLDHPTLWAGAPTELTPAGYENVMYLCVNRIADSACSISLDGGLAWTPFAPVFEGVREDGSICGGLHAHGVSAPDGTAYLPKGQCGTPMVAVTEDNGLTWEQRVISHEVGTVGHEVAIATDEAGTLFAFWINHDLQPYLAVSEDQGQSWTTPVKVAPPEVAVTSHPTIAAAGNGSIAMAYVGTETDAEAYNEMDQNATWNAYMTVATPKMLSQNAFATTTANDPSDPIGLGVCGGTRCRAADDGGIGDFIDITIDDEGRPWAAFVDVCLEQCLETGEPHREKGIGLIGTLAEGPSLMDPSRALGPLEHTNVTATVDANGSTTGLPGGFAP